MHNFKLFSSPNKPEHDNCKNLSTKINNSSLESEIFQNKSITENNYAKYNSPKNQDKKLIDSPKYSFNLVSQKKIINNPLKNHLIIPPKGLAIMSPKNKVQDTSNSINNHNSFNFHNQTSPKNQVGKQLLVQKNITITSLKSLRYPNFKQYAANKEQINSPSHKIKSPQQNNQKNSINKVQGIINSIKKRQKFLSPALKRADSPGSTAFSNRYQFPKQSKIIQQRKQSDKIITYDNSPRKMTNPSISKFFIPEEFPKKEKLIPKELKEFRELKQKKIFFDEIKQKQKSICQSQKKFLLSSISKKSPPPVQIQDPSQTQSTIYYKTTKDEDLDQIETKSNIKTQKNFKASPLQRRLSTNTVVYQLKNSLKVSDFFLGKVIGNGKFGEVCIARHKKTGFLVAIKCIYKSKIKQYNMQKQLLEQIKLQAFVTHPNIVNLYGIMNDVDHIYLILEYMEGGTLFQFLHNNQTKIPEKQVAFIMKQITLAVKYLHHHEIAHRDIKPQNIVFSLKIAKLCDFGWSARVFNKRKTYCGTFDYVPPQILQRKQYDEAVDLWCLGVLMYELLTGKVPFQHKQKTILMNRIINVDKQKIYYPSYISKTAIDIIQKLLRKKPEERIKAQNLLDHQFFKQVNNQ